MIKLNIDVIETAGGRLVRSVWLVTVGTENLLSRIIVRVMPEP